MWQRGVPGWGEDGGMDIGVKQNRGRAGKSLVQDQEGSWDKEGATLKFYPHPVP